MIGYISRRLLSLAFVLLVVSLIVFVLMNLVPGGPFTLADRGYSGAALENLERKYGLDKPIHVRYVNYVSSALQLDFGNSFSVAGNPPVTQTYLEDLACHVSTRAVYDHTLVWLGHIPGHHRGLPSQRCYRQYGDLHRDGGYCRSEFHNRYLVPVNIWISKWFGAKKASGSLVRSRRMDLQFFPGIISCRL